jgi:hypothetical protein
MRWGVISAAALGASGLAGVLIPEIRAGLGGTYAALAGWSLALELGLGTAALTEAFRSARRLRARA